MFFIDGFGRRQFDEALAEGRIPNIARHILDRGVRVESGVTCIPSITYAISVTFLTGKYPGHHGIVSNKWFEPSTGRYQNYCYIKTYQRVDDDYRASPTIYEILHDRVTVSIQAAMRRGCTHTIDNWATSGINWFFDNITGVDSLVAQRFELIAEHARRWGRWPDFIWVYFPGTDNIGHRFGPNSDRYKQAVANVDRQIGRICDALQDIGMYDRTYLCLVSDHGMVPVKRDNVFDIAAFLRERTGAKVWNNRFTEPGDEARLLSEYDYAVAITASRWSAVYPIPTSRHASVAEIKALAAMLQNADEEPRASARAALEVLELDTTTQGEQQLDSGATKLARGVAVHHMGMYPPSKLGGSWGHSILPTWLREAVDHPAVELAAISFRRGEVHLFSKSGYSVVTRSNDPNERHTVWQHPAGGVFEPGELPAKTRFEDETTRLVAPGASDSRAWLRATADSRYPDLVPQIVAMFDSERAGNIVFFAAEGWDFSTDDPAGGHGSILADDMCVPMLFAGPGLAAGGTIPFSRTCDLAPTLLYLLDAEPVLKDGTRVDMDGINLLPCRDVGRMKDEG